MDMKRFGLGIIVLVAFLLGGCYSYNEPVSSSGVKKVTVSVPTNASGRTTEQENVANRLQQDNKPGAIKYLYVISAFSGDVIFSSVVNGKVTSSGKRLSPTTVSDSLNEVGNGVPVALDGKTYFTQEVTQDDGTYGSSIEYIYWWDTSGVYHQHYITGGHIVHIASAPTVTKKPIINMEMVAPEEGQVQSQTPQVEEPPAPVQK